MSFSFRNFSPFERVLNSRALHGAILVGFGVFGFYFYYKRNRPQAILEPDTSSDTSIRPRSEMSIRLETTEELVSSPELEALPQTDKDEYLKQYIASIANITPDEFEEDIDYIIPKYFFALDEEGEDILTPPLEQPIAQNLNDSSTDVTDSYSENVRQEKIQVEAQIHAPRGSTSESGGVDLHLQPLSEDAGDTTSSFSF